MWPTYIWMVMASTLPRATFLPIVSCQDWIIVANETTLNFVNSTNCCRFQKPHGLRYESTATRFLELGIRIPSGARMSVSSLYVLCCQVQVTATVRSLFQRIPTEWGESWIWSTNLIWGLPLGFWATSKKKLTQWHSNRVHATRSSSQSDTEITTVLYYWQLVASFRRWKSGLPLKVEQVGFYLIHVPCIFYYFVLWPINAKLFHKLSYSYVFRHYRVILRELVINTLPSYRSIANAAAGKTIYN
jgi:hypothetical protein